MKLLQRIRRSKIDVEVDNASNPLVREVLRLVKQQKYDAVMEILLNNKVDMKEIIEGSSRIVKEPFLFYVLRHKPGADVVTLINVHIDRLANAGVDIETMLFDSNGKIPLHVAAEYGCGRDVTRCLLDDDGFRATIRDNHNRCPLHWAVANESKGRRRKTQSDKRKMFETVLFLLSACPEMVVEEDLEGNTPLDLALMNKCDQAIIDLLEANASAYGKVSDMLIGNECRAARAGKKSGFVPSIISEISSTDDDDLSSIGWDGELW